MTSAYPNQPIAPKTSKPDDYTDITVIKKSIDVLDSDHLEYDVSRAALLILTHYFPLREEWSIVPEFRVAEGKRPDYMIEKFLHNDNLLPKRQFVPKIALELKGGKGKSLIEAINQSVASMVTLVDDIGEDFSIFLIIVRGKTLGFFEYHNNRNDLYQEAVQHHYRALPFNLPQQTSPPGRPFYKGTGLVPFEDEYAGPNERLEDMAGAFLDIEKDSVTIQNVLNWMKLNGPLSGPNL